MAEEYPLPKFHFQVEWGEGTKTGFTEVTGLDVESEVIEYRHGASPEYHKTKMPGLQKYADITMKRGTFKDDNDFYKWWNTVALNKIERRDLTISLLNEEHEPVVTWKVKRAWPKKVSRPTLKPTAARRRSSRLRLFTKASRFRTATRMSDYYPPSSFHFRVDFVDLGAEENDTYFRSVSGLSATIETEAVKEGGENRFTHELPTRTKYSDLVLKRGVLVDSTVIAWCRDALEGFLFQPTTVLVHLLNDEHQPLVTWNVVHAWPKKCRRRTLTRKAARSSLKPWS